jgi:hypothetical protein
MTAGLLQSTKTKHKLFKKKINKQTQENIIAYKRYNIEYNKIKRKIKKIYYETKLNTCKHDMKSA